MLIDDTLILNFDLFYVTPCNESSVTFGWNIKYEKDILIVLDPYIGVYYLLHYFYFFLLEPLKELWGIIANLLNFMIIR